MLADPFLSPPRLLEVAQVAHRLNMGEAFVRRLIRAGKLPAHRIGKQLRVDPVDLQAYIDAQRVAIAHEERDLDRQLESATDRVRALRQA
jgi:excisionase family DNA binding protein